MQRWPIVALVCALIVLPILSACSSTTVAGPPLNVVATIAPLADWARQVGQDRVRVTQIVPVGVNPETYTPRAQDKQAIATADVVILNGLGVEPWLDDLLKQAQSTRLIALDLSQFLVDRSPRRALVRSPLEGEADGRSSRTDERELVLIPPTIYSSYLWLDPGPTMAQRSISLIADTFARVDPDRLLVYRRNAEMYNGELENLDSWVRRQIRAWPRLQVGSQSLLALQMPDRRWYYFTQRYDIKLRAPGDLSTISPALPSSTPLFIDSFVTEEERLRALGLRAPDGVLAPLGTDNYVQLIRQNVDVMGRGLQRAARLAAEPPRIIRELP